MYLYRPAGPGLTQRAMDGYILQITRPRNSNIVIGVWSTAFMGRGEGVNTGPSPRGSGTCCPVSKAKWVLFQLERILGRPCEIFAQRYSV
jgi:hypothetical protein